MANQSLFQCHQCDAQTTKWAGQCQRCKAWNSLESLAVAPSRRGFAGVRSEITALEHVSLAFEQRITTSLPELDRVLGGGLMPSMVVLIGGEPGIGKSTLLLQICAHLAQSQPVLYVTGEESLTQIANRAERLRIEKKHAIHLIAETQWEQVVQNAAPLKPKALVVDSIQTMYSSEVDSMPGSSGQMREVTARMVHWTKAQDTILFIVGHVTKEGVLAGPKMLEHMVDTVLYFENADDQRFRLLRATKNRYGSVNELGIFAMMPYGLKHIANPSALFISQAAKPTPGSTITVTWEGSRALLVEIQALVDQSRQPHLKKISVGLDPQRVALLLAVLNKHANVAMVDQDIFVNVVGGIDIDETSADLATLFALLSSWYEVVLPRNVAMIGEVGLTGEIRPVPFGSERAKAASQHGFQTMVMPKLNCQHPIEGLNVLAVSTLQEALDAFHQLKETVPKA